MFKFFSRKPAFRASENDTPDVQLQQALRSLPIPTLSPTFNQKVLSQVPTPTAAQTLPLALSARWLPRIALVALLATLVVPATRSVLEVEAHAQYNVWLGEHYPAPAPPPGADVLKASEQWVTRLPLLTAYLPASFDRSAASQSMADRFASGQFDTVTAFALRDSRTLYRDNPAFLAARLRYMRSGLNYQAAELRTLEADAVRGEQLEPRNAFWPAMRCATLLRRNHGSEAVELLQTLPRYPDWNDHRREELLARYRYEKTRGALSATALKQRLNRQLLAESGFHSIALSGRVAAANREKIGKLRDGAAIRYSLMYLADKLYTQPGFPVDTTANILSSAAQLMVGGQEAILGPNGEYKDGPDIVKTWLIRDERGQIIGERTGRQRDMNQSMQWEMGRPGRFLDFLRKHGEPEWQETARRVLDADNRYTQWRDVTQGIRTLPRESTLVSVWRWIKTPEWRLRVGWSVLAPLYLGAVTCLLLAAVLTGLPRLPLLKRREEFPGWIIVGGVSGGASALVGAMMSGLYGVTGVSLPLPAFATLVLGVGYLSLRKPRLIALSALAALGGAWLIPPLLVGLSYQLTRVLHILDETNTGTSAVPLVPWPLVLLVALGGAAALLLTLSRARSATWQAACQWAGRWLVRTAVFLMVGFVAVVAGIAIGEQGAEHRFFTGQTDTSDPRSYFLTNVSEL